MTCLPATGGPAAGLVILGVLLVAAGLVLTLPRRSTRVLVAALLVLGVAGASTLTPTEAQAASTDCAPASPGQPGQAGQPGQPGTPSSPQGLGPHGSDPDFEPAPGADPGRRHTLTYRAGAGGTLGGTTKQQVRHGGTGTAVTALPQAGHRFVRWSDGKTANPRTDRSVTADLTVTATFAAKTYQVRYLAGPGGILTGATDQQVGHGRDATPVTAVSGAGHHFVRWSDGSTTNPRTDTNVVADLSVSAEFARTVVRLQYVAGPGGTLTGDLDQRIDRGASGTTVTAVPDAGRTFVRWSDGSTDNPRTDTAVLADATLTAVFAARTYVLTYLPGPGGTVSPGAPQLVEHGADGPAVTVTPSLGHHFVRWSDGSTANPRTDTAVTADLNVTAELALDTHTASYTAGPGGSIGGTTPQTLTYGSDATAVTADPDTGFRFVRWSDGSTANPRTDTTVTADLSVTAEFAVQTYRAQYLAGADGSVAGDADQTVDHGADTTAVTAVPDAGFYFARWSDGSTANPRTDAAVVADLTVTAEFETSIALPLHGVASGSVPGTTARTIRLRNPDSATAEYVLVPTNRGPQATQLEVGVTGNAHKTAVAPGGSLNGADTHATARRSAVALAEARRGQTSSDTPLVPPARVPAGAVPVAGQAMTLNRDPSSTCSTGAAVAATVRAVGDHVVLVADDTNPAGGFDATDYADLLASLEAVATAVTDVLGDVSDVDQNGRVVVFVTRGLNELSPPASSQVEIARALPRDLLTQTECATSNVGEVVYAMAPDPTGVVNSNVRTLTFAKGQLPSAFAHELAHQIMDGGRLAAGTSLDGTWLAEAVADMATETAFYPVAAGLQPMQNIRLNMLTTGPNAGARVGAFNTFVNANFTRYRAWLQAPTANPILGPDDAVSLATRGAAWAFLGYAADRKAGGSVSTRNAFLRSLVTGPQTGTGRLAAVLGTDPGGWLQDFAVAAYTDDRAGLAPLGTSLPFTMLSWDFPSVFTGLGGFPLTAAALDTDESTTNVYAPQGGSRHVLFDIAAGATATVTLTAFAPANPDVGYRIVRLR
ncbi:InlB B-repeat-containing protein [Pimelobacter simplex]|uniref:InlB B-repeat-containing protein n=1 Tax=Nocardioides simplex TaxID=2045 RepID=UPI003AAC9DF7